MAPKTQLEFFLNGQKKVLQNPDPTQTVLEYVRSTGLTGTKLGCQEGGCGACTVTLAEWDVETQKPYFYAINGCLTPIIALDGKHLTTVEGIGNSAAPHAAQERIAKMHGSQCGFCTPGIVMSLYSLLRQTEGKPTREQISEAFDGNLCRCTGYKPIIDAAATFVTEGGCCGGSGVNGGCCKQQTQTQLPSPESNSPSPPASKRRNIDDSGRVDASGCCGKSSSGDCCKSTEKSLTKDMRAYPHAELIFPPALKRYRPELVKLEDPAGHTWYRPTSIDELKAILKDHPTAKLIGGASEFQIEAKIRGDEHQVCVYVLEVPELKTFEHIEGRGIRFGADIPLSVLENKLELLVEVLPKERTEFFQAIIVQLKYFAGRQIRNVATPAGNVATASPISDLNPVFTAANAELEVLDPNTGKFGTISMGDFDSPFFTGYRKTQLNNRLLTHIVVPESKPGSVVRSFKQAKRKDDDISIVTACCYSRFSKDGFILESRLAYGGVAPMTVLAKASKLLVGKPVSSLEADLGVYLDALDKEFSLPYSVPGGMAVFRRSLILSFFYKFAQATLQQSGKAADDAALLEVTRSVSPKGVRDLRNDYEQEILGKSFPHVNALKQVTGEALYVDDVLPTPFELHAVQVMSSKALAKVVSINYDDALAVDGVVGKLDINDVPGSNRWGIFQQIGPERLFVEDKAEYIGDCVAVIVARTHNAAVLGARRVKVEYKEEEDPVVTIEQAIEKNSFFDIQNKIERGDFEKEWNSAAYKFEGQCRIGAQEHFYLEPQGSLVVPEDACHEFKIYASTQNPNETQLVAASALGIPASRIVARAKRLGGGFGGKESRSVHVSTLAALAANKFGKPVRMILSRSEDMVQAGQRHPFLIKWRVTLDKNYKFTGIQARLYGNAGYSMDLTKGVIDRAALHIDNCYDFGQNISIVSKPCRTNLASNTAFRGFGGPQGMLGAESIIYDVSEQLGLKDPEELRRINYYPTDGTGRTHYLQWLGDDFTVPQMAEELRAQVNYDNLRKEVDAFNAQSKWIKRGLACVPTKFGIAFGVPHLNQAGALVHIYEDGSILLAHGGTEMGQGLHTKMTMVCAAELGVPVEGVFISETATNTVANASPTAASASSDLNGMAVKHACDQLNERLKPYREKLGPQATMHDIAHAAYFDRVNLSANGYYKMPDVGYCFDNSDLNPKPAFQYFTQGVAVSLVEADMLTGDWANLRTDIIMDIGRPINQAIDYGQIEGAFVQGQGLFTIEESLWTQKGSILTRGPGAYKIPGFRDIPQHFNVAHLQSREFKHLKTINRSKGIGEPPLFLGSTPMFALRDAIKSARVTRGLPMIRNIDAPLTTERIRVAAGDEIVDRAQVKVEGPSFSIRS